MSSVTKQSPKRLSLLGLLVLTGCGGGGTDNAPPAPQQNTAPVFSMGANVDVEENTTGSILDINVSDPEGNAITLQLTGEDASLFVLDSAVPTLRLETILDFEAPADADADNAYEITLTATDSVGASFDITIRLTDSAELLVSEVLASGLSNPVQIVAIPNSEELLVIEQGGLVRVLTPQTGAISPVPFLDVSAEVSGGSEQGLLGLAFSPDFASDLRVFVNLTNLNDATEIRSYETFSALGQQVDAATENLILRIDQPFENHNAGWIGFDNAGDMLIPTGDGGGVGDPQNNAQNPNILLGKVLRINLDSDEFPADDNRDYAIPPSNPFATGGGAPEIYALGLRNPYRASLDTVSGDLLIGDVGQNEIEEVDRVLSQTPGLNFGWNLREGSQPFDGAADQSDFTPPLLEYGHGDGPFEGNSIVGGFIYRGPISVLNETYVFGDTISSNVWFIPSADLEDGETLGSSAFTRLNDLVSSTFDPGTITSFGIAPAGELLITDLEGSVFSIRQTP